MDKRAWGEFFARAKVIAAITAALSLFGAGEAQAKLAPYLFDPVLSLTGKCEEPTTEDSVPDLPCPEGAHPPSPFSTPRSAATDVYGDLFVPNTKAGGGIDVFNTAGFFIAHISGGQLDSTEVEDVAVDGEGHLYGYGFALGEGGVVFRCDPEPEQYDPENGAVAYLPCVVLLNGLGQQSDSIAVDAHNNLYVGLQKHIKLYGPAKEGNPLLDAEIGENILTYGRWVTVDSRNGDIFAGDHVAGLGSASVVRVFSPSLSGYHLKRTISGFSTGVVSPAVDETSGRVLVGDLQVRGKVYVFPDSEVDQAVESGTPYVAREFELAYESRIAVDNGAFSSNKGYLFVPSEAKTHGSPYHVYAFKPIPPPCKPEVKSVASTGVGETDADLEAVINPCNAETRYAFEYVTLASYEANGFDEATLAGEGEIPAGDTGVGVSTSLSGLEPGTEYRVRVQAENCSIEEPERECTGEGETSFRTYPAVRPLPPCPNEPLRSGPSAHLPDCRAYELVTPPDTGGRPPISIGVSFGDLFGTPTVTADGNNVSFVIGSGGIPGLGGAGGFFGDGYIAERGEIGWRTHLDGPSGTQSRQPGSGGLSPDHRFAAWATASIDQGELFLGGETHYVRYPDGSFHLVGRGSGTDPHARVKRITDASGHMIFEGSVQLEPQAPATGTRALYDRTIDPLTGEEETHVVSLLPEDKTPEEGEQATYEGSSADGSAVAFKLGATEALTESSPLYLRLNNAETLQAAVEPDTEFAGLSGDGRYLFYAHEGDLFRCDAQTRETASIAESGDALMANVSVDGSHAYFVSPSVLTGEEENGQGDKAVPGGEDLYNLYVWNGNGVRFVATVTARDVKGELVSGHQRDGLGLWVSSPTGEKPVTEGSTALDSSRTTADGNVFLFESRAVLTGYDSGGKAEVYRFDAEGGSLRCLSCSPIGSAAFGDASLQTVDFELFDEPPTKRFALIPNLRDDGRRAFFESSDPLVLADTDKTKDVYEWEEAGVGSCEEPEGCIYLISSGQSSRPSYLYGVSATGNDVFFTTTDLLTGADQDATPSIYDARVEGGFAEGGQPACEAEACRLPLTPPPPAPIPTTGSPGGQEPLPRHHPCPKGKRKVRRNGKTRCVKAHRHHRRHRSRGKR